MPGEADGPSLLNRRSAESMAKNAGKVRGGKANLNETRTISFFAFTLRRVVWQLIELFSVFDPESSGTVAMADFALILKAVAVRVSTPPHENPKPEIPLTTIASCRCQQVRAA